MIMVSKILVSFTKTSSFGVTMPTIAFGEILLTASRQNDSKL